MPASKFNHGKPAFSLVIQKIPPCFFGVLEASSIGQAAFRRHGNPRFYVRRQTMQLISKSLGDKAAPWIGPSNKTPPGRCSGGFTMKIMASFGFSIACVDSPSHQHRGPPPGPIRVTRSASSPPPKLPSAVPDPDGRAAVFQLRIQSAPGWTRSHASPRLLHQPQCTL